MLSSHQLNVCLFGSFSLSVNNEQQRNIRQPQQQSLLAYLMLRTETPQLRKHIAFLFWPDCSEERAFANLRGALHKLRNDCPVIDHYLVSTSTTLSWQRPAAFSLDILDFEQLIARIEGTTDPVDTRELYIQAVQHYRGELLPGCYDDWILPERERLNQSYIHLLHQLVNLLFEEGNYDVAVQYAAQLRTADPFRERTYRLQMTLYETLGDRASALRVYHECVTMLERELGVEPGPETKLIYGRILNRTVPLTPPKPLPAVARLSRGDRLVGRKAEWQTLLAAWHKAAQGHPRLILITGEAGIGKTHLGEALLSWANQHDQLTVHTRAYAAEGQLTYTPVIEWLRSPLYAGLSTALEDVWLSECARLLPEILATRPDMSVLAPLRDNWQRQRLFEALTRAVLLPQQPILVLVDDLQWADKETLEWLHFLLRFDKAAPLLLVGTARMSEVTAEHPLTNLHQELHRVSRIDEISLAPLTAEDSDELAQQTAGAELTADTLAKLRRYAEGVPLFLVETIRAEIDKPAADRWRWSNNTPISAPNTLPIPRKVYAVIHSRLNQLSSGAHQLANVAAVIGRSFSVELLALAGQRSEAELVKELDELWQRRIVRETGGKYDLGHDRIRDVAYAEISPIQRKLLHRHVAEALSQRHAANLDDVSSQLAFHYEAAGLYALAVEYYLQAGQVAQRMYANQQACELLKRSIALLNRLPPTSQRDKQALAIYGTLAASFRMLYGWTSTEMYETILNAWELSQTLNDLNQHFLLVKLLHAYYLVRGELDKASVLVDEELQIAQQEQSDPFFVIGHNNQAGIYFFRGRLDEAHSHFEKSLNLYDARQHQTYVALDGVNYGIVTMVWDAHNLWLLGDVDQAFRLGLDSTEMSEQLDHPFSKAMAWAYMTMHHHFRKEYDQVLRSAEICLSIVKEYSIGYYDQWANIFRAWSQSWKSPTPLSFRNFQNALDEFQKIGAGLRWPYYLSMLAEIHEKAKRVDEGLETVNRAFSATIQYDEVWWNAELYRLRGNLLLLKGSQAKAEDAYQEGISLAREQGALSLELRGAMSLAQLWKSHGRGTAGYELLSAVYNQFTEGFETPDLREAQALLIVLS